MGGCWVGWGVEGVCGLEEGANSSSLGNLSNFRYII